MYHLSSYVLGGIVTALVLTPFVSGPDRSFVGTLLATSAPEPIVTVNRALKGDRKTPASMLAEHSPVPQSIMPKSTGNSATISGANGTPASFTAPRSVPGLQKTGQPTDKSPPAKSRMLDGCESAFSEITDRQLADIPGRCMAALPETPVQFATLN